MYKSRIGCNMDEDRLSMETYEGEPLPDRVLDVVAPSDQWVENDPRNVVTYTELGDELLYRVEVPDGDGVKTVLSNDWGDTSSPDRFEWVGRDPADGCYTLDGYAQRIHHDCMREHVTRAIAITPAGEKLTLNSRSGVLWLDRFHGLDLSDDDVDELLRFMESKSDLAGHGEPDTPSGWGNVADGWHSGMEKSSYSEKINSITRGEAHKSLGWSFPVVVKFGDTNNCCTTSVSVYAPEMHISTVVDALKKSHGVGYRGLKEGRAGSSSTGVGSRSN